MTWKRMIVIFGGGCICCGLFVALMAYKQKAIATRGQLPFFLLICSIALFLAGLLIAAVSDAKTREIPNATPLLLLAAGALKLALTPSTSALFSALLGAFLGGFPLLILALFSHSIGGGDVKLAASAGLALGWLGSYLALLVGLAGFVLYGGVKCVRRKHNPPNEKENPAFPFAPAYAVGGIAVLILFVFFSHSPLIGR